LRNPFGLFQSRRKKSSSGDPLEITTDRERRRLFLRYVNLGWLSFGIVTLITLPLFPGQRSVFAFLIALTFPTYLIIHALNRAGRTLLAGVVLAFSVNFGFYGLFMVLVGELGAYKAFESEATVWMLMGLAVLFAGAFVDKWAAPGLAAIDTILLVGTRLGLAPGSEPRPGPVVFWWMMALTIWLYERTLGEASGRVLIELAERKQAEGSLQESEQRMKALADAAFEGIMIHDNGMIVDVNQAFVELFGYDRPQDLIGLNGLKVLPFSPESLELIKRNMEVDSSRPLDITILRPDGSLLHAETQGRDLTMGGRTLRIVTVRDISERKRAEEAIRQRFGELQALYEVSNAISAEHDLNALLRTIVESARKLLHSASSGIYLSLPASEQLELTVDTEPYIPFGARLHFGEGVAGRVAQTQRPLRVDDYSTWEGRSPLYEGAGLRAVLEVPMLYKGELIGVLTADEVGESGRKFTEADEHLLSLFASQAAGAIHSARLREQTVQRLSELEVLYQSGLALSQPVNPHAIAQKIIDLLDQKMDWHHTAIRLYRPEDGSLELLAFSQPEVKDETERSALEKRFVRAVARSGQGLSGWAVQHGETVRSNDLRNDPRYVDTFPGLQSGLYVPMKIGEQVIGVISIESEQIEAFSESDERLTITLATQAAVAIENAQLLNDLLLSNTSITSAYDATIEGWSRAMDLRDKETEGHTQRVTELTLSMARSMGLSEDELTHIRRGGLLHDMGKLGVPDNILLKNENLTAAEWEIMRKHPTYAFEMLSSIAYLQPALEIPYCHHEMWDGRGYPRGLRGEEIPLSARIFAVADVWDALTSDRPYRPAWSKKKAIEHIKGESGKHFDPQIVKAFLRLVDNE
jgi:PAS domain S-box-containing protein